MTIERMIALIGETGADAWEITDTTENGWEFYFIQRRLDQNRAKLTRSIYVKLYKKSEDGKFLGSASGEIAPTAADDEVRRKLSGLLYSASFVRNPFYTLNPPVAAEGTSEEAAVDPADLSKAFLTAMRGLPETENEDINSWELFVSAVSRRYMNSRGVDVTETSPRCMLEAVVNARREGHEIELYRLYTMGGCDRDALRADLTDAMRYGRDRLIARKTPNLGKADVVFSTDAALEIYNWFIMRMDATLKARGMSDWETDQNVMGEGNGDRITVKTVRYLPNSTRNALYDAEGAPVSEVTVIDSGIARRFLGCRQFSQYLGLDVSFIPGNYSVTGGTHTADEIRSGSFLEVVEFSDFQVNPVTGDIAGEIRLGYLHDGETVTPVCGGSVTGNMRFASGDMLMSKAQRQYDTRHDSRLIPALTRLNGLSVTGA